MLDLFEIQVERLAKWAKGEKAPPVVIELIPTDRCNLRCKTCWRQSMKKEQLEKMYRQEMSDKRLLDLIDEAAELGVKEIAFVGGGEPLCRKVTLQLIKRIKENRMMGDLVTNGTFFNKKTIEYLVKVGWDIVKFSVDGPDTKVHDALRGAKCFETIVRNAKAFSNLKKSLNTEVPRLNFNTVISDANYRLLPDIVELGHEIGINEILLLPMTVFDESMRPMKLTEEEIKEFNPILRQSIELAKTLGIENNFSNFLEAKYVEKTDRMDEVMMEDLEKGFKKEYPESKDSMENFKFLPCFAPWNHITILPNGNIAPCFSPWVWETGTSIKNHLLKELWYGEYFDKFRNIMLTRKLPAGCKTCCVWEVFKNKKIRNEIDKFI